MTGHFKDLSGNAKASALLEVYFDDDPNSGLGWQLTATIFSGYVNDGATVSQTYTMTRPGFYQFQWTCEGSMNYGEVRTLVGPVIPEPGTLAGLAMALSAFGVFVMKNRRVKVSL